MDLGAFILTIDNGREHLELADQEGGQAPFKVA